MYTTEKSFTIALDVEAISGSRKGKKVINAFMDAASVQFRTARGHLALLAPLDRFEHIKRVHRFAVEDSFDGLKAIVLEVQPKPQSETVAVAE